MPEHASRFIGLYDQQNENRIPDWGGDELFTRMPSPPAVDDAPAPRFRPSLVLVDAPQERRSRGPLASSAGAAGPSTTTSDGRKRGAGASSTAGRLGMRVNKSSPPQSGIRFSFCWS